MHQWDGAIKGGRRRGKILEDISIIEAIGFVKEGILAGSGGEIEGSSTLGDTVNVAMAGKIYVE
jgi:hypothetical protein